MQIKSIGFDRSKRNKYIQAVMNAYDDGDLFNAFLTLNKIGYFIPPIAKTFRHGVVNFIIFYGQGGKNLDNLLGGIQPERFKKRLEEFDEFYEANAETIREVIADDKAKKPAESTRREPRVVLLSDSEDMEQTEDTSKGNRQQYDDDSVTSDDDMIPGLEEARTFTGKGINRRATMGQALINRLNTLHSSKMAGNTSLEVNNEGQDILKTLLKRGVINKSKYYKLEKLF